MNEITRKDWAVRIVLGGLCGLALQAAIATFCASISLFGPSKFHFAFFTPFGYPSVWSPVQQLLFDLACTALMFAFGAEIGVATLPFDDDGKRLLWKSLLHFVIMALTVMAWATLNFGRVEAPWFLTRLAVIYAIVWGLRWLKWYFEFKSIKEKLDQLRKGGGENG